MKTSSYGSVPNRGAITGPRVGGNIFDNVGDRKSNGDAYPAVDVLKVVES